MKLNQMFCTSIRPFSALALALVLTGCASSGVRNPSGTGVTVMNPDEAGFVGGTGVESQDVVAVTDKIARTILATPEIANAQGIPRVVLLPVENNTRFRINSDLFLTRIRLQLNEKALNRVRFLDRKQMAALEAEVGRSVDAERKASATREREALAVTIGSLRARQERYRKELVDLEEDKNVSDGRQKKTSRREPRVLFVLFPIFMEYLSSRFFCYDLFFHRK